MTKMMKMMGMLTLGSGASDVVRGSNYHASSDMAARVVWLEGVTLVASPAREITAGLDFTLAVHATLLAPLPVAILASDIWHLALASICQPQLCTSVASTLVLYPGTLMLVLAALSVSPRLTNGAVDIS